MLRCALLLHAASPTTLLLLLLLASCCDVTAGRNPYIVNGREVEAPGRWPWQASLQMQGSHVCGASLISRRWLITAAHCYHAAPPDSEILFSVVLGAHDIYWEISPAAAPEGSPRRYSIDKFITHPDYIHGVKFSNDIAVVQLSRHEEVELNDHVKPVSLPQPSEYFYGHDCWISGWGSLQTLEGPLPDYLQELKVAPISNLRCDDYMPFDRPSKDQVCVKGYGAGACAGDSGGPLSCRSQPTGEWVVAGAAAFVIGECDVTFPSVYTSVVSHLSWIKNVTDVA